MEVTGQPYAGKEQKKIREKERLREGFLRIIDGEKYICTRWEKYFFSFLYTFLYIRLRFLLLKMLKYMKSFFRSSLWNWSTIMEAGTHRFPTSTSVTSTAATKQNSLEIAVWVLQCILKQFNIFAYMYE